MKYFRLLIAAAVLAAVAFAQNPVVRLSYVTLLSGQAATTTVTSAAIRLPNLSGYGTLTVTGSGITGSPSGCQIALEMQQSAGAPASSAVATQAFTPGNSYQSFQITPGTNFASGDTIVAVYSCTVYPTAGTITVTFDPAVPAAIVWPLPAGSNVIGGITQSGTWTLQPGNTPNTTPWLMTISQGGNSATVSAGGALKVDNSAVTQPVSGTVTPIAGTSGASTPYHLVSAATTNATSVKASAGTVYVISAFNLNASPRYLKLFDKASSPTVGTDTPVLTLMIPGNTTGTGFTLSPSVGIAFSTGVAFAITGGMADNDTTAIAAAEVVVNLSYK